MSLDGAPVRRHSGLGIASFILSLVMAAILFLNFGVASYTTATGTATPGVNALIGIVLFFCWFLGLVSIGLGIAGTRDKSTKNGFAIAGMGISTAAMTFSLGLMIIGLLHHA